jgi:thiamine-phosphate pyrophosphorylase
VRLPDPPLLLITDRQQALLPLADVVRAALATGCRWVSMREKDLSEVDQVALARTLGDSSRCRFANAGERSHA